MLVSVIVPFYKGNKYIFDLCSSIEKNVNYLKEKQSDCLIECIIVNDSPDVNVILPDVDFNFKIQVVYHEKNAGIQQARVTGLEYAKGDYIVFLDQDDELLNYAIFEEINNIDNADVLICNALIENEKHETHKLYSTNGMQKNALTLNAYIFGHNRIVSPGHCMIKKTSIPIEWKQNIMEVNGSDDLFLWILMFSKGSIFKADSKPVYIHKNTGENLSAASNAMTQSSLSMVKYLSQIDYVNDYIVKSLERDRAFFIKLEASNGVKKILLMISHIDLIFKHLKYKVQSKIN
ncbi:glycosyltransferase family 2 protein [Holdemanella porci]|uniref:glycosyltransferase family 2 protein n=1 Tax=Holdemanella porci TaxID=2652276 RepID=UPI002942BC4A|nr:glycosyltransferase family 2 protein [Holdemanella porci]